MLPLLLLPKSLCLCLLIWPLLLPSSVLLSHPLHPLVLLPSLQPIPLSLPPLLLLLLLRMSLLLLLLLKKGHRFLGLSALVPGRDLDQISVAINQETGPAEMRCQLEGAVEPLG
jgi:hypothetical protein